MRQVRFSVRARLTALYGGLFLLAGVVLLVINYVLVRTSLPDAQSVAVSGGGQVAILVDGSGAGGVASGPPAGSFDWHSDPGGAATLPNGIRIAGGASADSLSPEDLEVIEAAAPALNDFRDETLSALLTQSVIALLIMVVVAVALGWVTATRALRPVHDITATARRLSAANLDRRIEMRGPNDEIKELADTFDDMLDRLAASFDSQRRFVANASHELRTPLAVQRALAEVAMSAPNATSDVRQLATKMLATNQRSEKLIEGLLLLARSDRGLAERKLLRLDQIVAGAVDATIGVAAEHEVTVHTRLEKRSVYGDAVLLERMVTNLLQNAIRYNETGGSVRVEIDDHPALTIENTGPPVPAGKVPALFEPFRRLATGRNRNDGGAGLGLSIVKSIATAHGGSVSAKPGKGGGLAVSVDLPFAPAEVPSDQDGAASSRSSSGEIAAGSST